MSMQIMTHTLETDHVTALLERCMLSAVGKRRLTRIGNRVIMLMMYLEIIVEAELAGRLPNSGCRSAGSEVIAQLTGRTSAV